MTSQNQAERKVGYYNGTALGWRRNKTRKTHRKGKRAYKRFMARARRILDKVLSRNDKEE
jgi:hypothetical protein